MDEKTTLKYLYELPTSEIVLVLLPTRCKQYLAVCEERKTEDANVFLLGNRKTTLNLQEELDDYLFEKIKEDCGNFNVAVDEIYSDREIIDHISQELRYVYEYSIEDLIEELKHRGEFTIAYKVKHNSKTIIASSCENDIEEYQEFVGDAIDYLIDQMDQNNDPRSYWWKK